LQRKGKSENTHRRKSRQMSRTKGDSKDKKMKTDVTSNLCYEKKVGAAEVESWGGIETSKQSLSIFVDRLRRDEIHNVGKISLLSKEFLMGLIKAAWGRG